MGTCTRIDFFGSGQKSRHLRGQTNLKLFFWLANNELWGPDEHLHHSLVFCRLATKSRNPTSKKPDSPRNRPISEHTLVQPRTSSSDIEWGTPFPPTPSLKYCIMVRLKVFLLLLLLAGRLVKLKVRLKVELKVKSK